MKSSVAAAGGAAVSLDPLLFPAWLQQVVGNVSGGAVFEQYPWRARHTTYTLPHVAGISDAEDAYLEHMDGVMAYLVSRGRALLAAPLVAGVLYLLAILVLQRWMSGRARYELRRPLIAWNAALCVFSVMGTARTVPEFVDILRSDGLRGSICNSRQRYTGVELWSALFTLSKLVELLDTGFVVLRKQKLIFLHWYHHVLTMLYVCYFNHLDANAPRRWFQTMNFSVHSLMYAFYAVKASRLVAVPRKVNVLITSAQVLQMIVGFTVSGWALVVKATGSQCEVTAADLIICNTMYFSYILLFGNFFYQTYMAKPQRPSPERKVMADLQVEPIDKQNVPKFRNVNGVVSRQSNSGFTTRVRHR